MLSGARLEQWDGRGGGTLERGGRAGESVEKRRKRYNILMSAEQVNSLCGGE